MSRTSVSISKPAVYEFKDDASLIDEVKSLPSKGVLKDSLYVISHADDRTDRVADSADANKVGLNKVGLETYVSNMFSNKRDELRNQLQELGISKQEAENYEEKLNNGTILLINTNTDV